MEKHINYYYLYTKYKKKYLLKKQSQLAGSNIESLKKQKNSLQNQIDDINHQIEGVSHISKAINNYSTHLSNSADTNSTNIGLNSEIIKLFDTSKNYTSDICPNTKSLIKRAIPIEIDSNKWTNLEKIFIDKQAFSNIQKKNSLTEFNKYIKQICENTIPDDVVTDIQRAMFQTSQSCITNKNETQIYSQIIKAIYNEKNNCTGNNQFSETLNICLPKSLKESIKSNKSNKSNKLDKIKTKIIETSKTIIKYAEIDYIIGIIHKIKNHKINIDEINKHWQFILTDYLNKVIKIENLCSSLKTGGNNPSNKSDTQSTNSDTQSTQSTQSTKSTKSTKSDTQSTKSTKSTKSDTQSTPSDTQSTKSDTQSDTQSTQSTQSNNINTNDNIGQSQELDNKMKGNKENKENTKSEDKTKHKEILEILKENIIEIQEFGIYLNNITNKEDSELYDFFLPQSEFIKKLVNVSRIINFPFKSRIKGKYLSKTLGSTGDRNISIPSQINSMWC
jgi:hypothetical protein